MKNTVKKLLSKAYDNAQEEDYISRINGDHTKILVQSDKKKNLVVKVIKGSFQYVIPITYTDLEEGFKNTGIFQIVNGHLQVRVDKNTVVSTEISEDRYESFLADIADYV